MLRQEMWMENSDEFDYILTKVQRVLKLSTQYENYLYIEEFTKECNFVFIYRTYVLEGETDENFSLNETWNLLRDVVDPLSSNAIIFTRQILNCMRALHFTQTKTSSRLSIELIKHSHKIMMHVKNHQDGKDLLDGKYRKLLAFAGFHIFATVEVKQDHPILAATNLSLGIIDIHPFEGESGRTCCLILGHLSMHLKCSLFPVL